MKLCLWFVETKECNLETPEQEYSENVQEVAKICV